MRRVRPRFEAALAVLIAVATAEAQTGPRVPTAPVAPAAPGAPGAPAVPGAPPSQTAATADLSGVLLLVNAGPGSVDTVVLRLSDALVAVTARDRRSDRAALDRLAVLLGQGLAGRSLAPSEGERMAVALSGALGGGAARDLGSALAQVRTALAAAGLGDSEIVLIDSVLRRAAGGR
jgi:hypothetical protein